MELTKENLDFIHQSLLERISDIHKIILGEDATADEKLNKYTKISSYFFVSAAIESLVIFIIDKKYIADPFSLSFMHSKMKFSGAFLDFNLIEKLLSSFNYNDIRINDFTNVFYPVCEKQIKQCVARTGGDTLFEQESFEEIYKAVKSERNRIAHEFTWTNNNFTAGMLVKFLKTYYVLYLYALTLIEK